MRKMHFNNRPQRQEWRQPARFSVITAADSRVTLHYLTIDSQAAEQDPIACVLLLP
jgi:hypothetical protein